MPVEQSIKSVKKEALSIPLKQELKRQFNLTDTGSKSNEEIYASFLAHITYLVDKDFHQLISLLYRHDVPENKLRKLLAERPDEDAATIITDLILERLSLKIKTREQYKTPQADPSDPEKW